MKLRSVSMSLAPLAFALGLVVTPEATQDGAALAQRVQLLESRLAQVETYLQAQAKAAEAQTKLLGAVEEQGFAAGANYKSREALLETLNASAKAAQTGVPGVEEKKDDDKGRGRRR
ncbi:MAG: hypothetical protein GY711_31490 [bacterium]|nr:hypothetical protein [bacterium]